MNNKNKSILLGVVLLSIGAFVGIRVFVNLNKVFKDGYLEYEQATNMKSNKNIELYSEQLSLYNDHIGQNIKAFQDERLADWPNTNRQ